MGRKRIDLNKKKVSFTVSVEQCLLEKLKKEQNRSQLITNLLKDYYKRKNM